MKLSYNSYYQLIINIQSVCINEYIKLFWINIILDIFMYIYFYKFIYVYFIFRKSEFLYLYFNFNSNCMLVNLY